MLLNCPKCDKSMVQVHSSKRGVSLDKCLQCLGFWIEKNDLNKLFQQNFEVKFSEYLDQSSLNKTDFGCPLCGHDLFRGMTKQNSLEIELCKTCEGVFVDHGELNLLINIEKELNTINPLSRIISSKLQTPASSSIIDNNPENLTINRNEAKTNLKEFLKILDNNENIVWNSRPSLLAYICVYLLPNLFIILVSLAYVVFVMSGKPSGEIPSTDKLYAGYFYSIGLYGVISLIGFIGAVFNYLNRIFVVTNKRVIESSGFLGIDFKSIDFEKTTDITLNISFFEKLLGLGTISLRSASGQSIKFNYTKKSHEVYKLIKSLTQK